MSEENEVLEGNGVKECLVRGIDVDIFNQVRQFASQFGAKMAHVNKIILHRGYKEILEKQDANLLKDTE
jgi:hypothetical protein